MSCAIPYRVCRRNSDTELKTDDSVSRAWLDRSHSVCQSSTTTRVAYQVGERTLKAAIKWAEFPPACASRARYRPLSKTAKEAQDPWCQGVFRTPGNCALHLRLQVVRRSWRMYPQSYLARQSHPEVRQEFPG